MKIITGKTKPKGLRIVIYGVHGVGKTTLASKLRKAVYMDYEGGTHGIDCAKVDYSELPKTYAGVKGMFMEFKKDHMGYENLVIDSADQLEEVFDKSVSAERGIESIFAVDDFFRTQKVHERKFGDVLDDAGKLVDSGMNVVFIAHEQARKVEPLEHNGGKTYDHSDLRLSKKCSQLLLQWADVVIFCAFKTFLIEGEKKGDKAHAGGGKRWCFTTYSPDWEAKHRASVTLPDDCSLDKMSEILPIVIADSTDPTNGCTTGEIIAREEAEEKAKVKKSEAKKEQQKESPKAEEPKPEKKDEPKDDLPKAVKDLRKLIAQFGVDLGKLTDYAASKLNDRYGIDIKKTEMKDWPEEAVLWLCRGMDKIAEKLK